MLGCYSGRLWGEVWAECLCCCFCFLLPLWRALLLPQSLLLGSSACSVAAARVGCWHTDDGLLHGLPVGVWFYGPFLFGELLWRGGVVRGKGAALASAMLIAELGALGITRLQQAKAVCARSSTAWLYAPRACCSALAASSSAASRACSAVCALMACDTSRQACRLSESPTP